LVKVESGKALQAAEAIYALNNELQETNNVLIRADVVTGPYDIMVAVDAESQRALSEIIIEMIQGIDGVTETLTAVVGAHYPWPPHIADAYITDEEQEAAPRGSGESHSVLRGDNPWG
jgi:DNA-binding Lrp family transcriptional regulator